MNFKSLREDKLRLSKEDFAAKLGVDVPFIEMLEINNSPSFDIIQKIAETTGLDFNTICTYEKLKPKVFNTKDTWKETDATKKGIINYIEDTLVKMDITDKQKEKYITELKNGIEQYFLKPSISIVGRSDTGKSTLINSLIGMDKLPTSWTPTTSIAIYIKHIKDRPSFIEDTTWVFADGIDDEEFWNVKKLYDQEYCEKWKIAQGDADILESFGTRQGDMFKKNAGSAVIFLDAPILYNCDIVDLPGFGTEMKSDDLITFKVAQQTDILIYLSQANGFMRIEDITYLKENIRNLPIWEDKNENNLKPLSNLFIVASQSHTVNNGNINHLNNIIKEGYQNYCKTLSPGYWTEREEKSGYDKYEENVLLKRFFTYTTDIPTLCTDFNNELKYILEVLPNIINNRTKLFISEYIKNRTPSLEAELKKHKDLLVERDKYVELLQCIKENDLRYMQNNNIKKSNLRLFIRSLSRESVNEFTSYCSQVINEDKIILRMKNQGLKNKKEDIEFFFSQLQGELQLKCNLILKEKSDILYLKIDEYLKEFEAPIKYSFHKLLIDIDIDFEYIFTTALTKMEFIGGMSSCISYDSKLFWRMIGTPNLIWLKYAAFLYIINPLALIISMALGGINFFRLNWNKRAAKKIVELYEEEKVTERLIDEMKKYWVDTEQAFNKASQDMELEWKKYVDTLEETINNYNIEDINSIIIELENLKTFFGNIPL